MIITVLNGESQPLEIVYESGNTTTRLQYAGNPAKSVELDMMPDGQTVTNIEEFAKAVADAGRELLP